jgi:hypothetical protein
LPTGHPPKTQWAWPQHSVCLVTWYSVLPQQHVADHMDWLHDIPNYTHEHLNLANDKMRTCYDHLANSANYKEGDQFRLHRPTSTKWKSPKLQPSWEGPHRIVTQTNDVVYRIQCHPRMKMRSVHLNQMAPLKTRSLKEWVVDEQQHQAQPMRDEDCMPLRQDGELLGLAQRYGALCEDHHRHHRHILAEEKWQYACRLLRMRSPEEGAMWHGGWMPE